MKSKNIFKVSDSSKASSFGGGLEEAEWLETNGLGGWASSSIIGCNTRRYHGLLIAATKPPAERMAFVSKALQKIFALSGFMK